MYPESLGGELCSSMLVAILSTNRKLPGKSNHTLPACEGLGVRHLSPHKRSQPMCRLTPDEQAVSQGVDKVTVAVRSGHLLATAFHPELTEDSRW